MLPDVSLKRWVWVFLIISINSVKLSSQSITISGNTCTSVGVSCAYNVTYLPAQNFAGTWCVGTGGIINQAFGASDATGGCKTGTNVVSIYVTWNTSGPHSVTFSPNQGYGNVTSLSVDVKNNLTSGAIAVASKNQSIAFNSLPATISCSNALGGACLPAYAYQWQQSTSQTSWTNLTGKTNQDLTMSSPYTVAGIYYYRRAVTVTESAQPTGTGTTDYSDIASVTVASAFTSTALTPGMQNIFNDGTMTTIASSAPTGGTCGGNYTYNWQSSSDGTSYSSVFPAANGLNYLPQTFSGKKYFRLQITCNAQVAYSNVAEVTVSAHLTAGSVSPSSLTINFNSNPNSFITASPATGGMCSSYNYQWLSSLDGNAYLPVAGANGQSYNPGNITSTTYFKRQVNNCGSESATTNVIKITVNPPLIAGTLFPGSSIVPANTSPGILTITPASGGGSSTYGYQWEKSADGTIFYPIIGATNLSYNPGNVSVTTYYHVVVSCGTENTLSAICTITVGTSNASLNYIKERTIKKPLVTDFASANNLTARADISQTIQYFDGLGRLSQTVVKQGSPAGYDVIAIKNYDEFGREPINYLPYVSVSSNGLFKTNALSEQSSFNTAQFPNEQFYFSKTEYEASPLNTIAKTLAPGTNWTGSNRGVSVKHWTNTATDAVRIWDVTEPTGVGSFGTYTSGQGAVYDAGSLYKNVTIDENDKQVIEFKDKEGKVILKKVQLSSAVDDGVGKDYPGWLCTYYIYDDFGNLRSVVQPRGVELLYANNWSMTALNNDILNEQCFRYEYDKRDHLIMKKVPGAGEVYMVYDARDRVVMTQDGNLRAANKWLVTLYDVLNRPEQTGLLLNTWNNNTFIQHLNAAYNSSAYPFDASSVPAVTYWDCMTKTGYDDYAAIPSASGLTATLATTYIISTYGFSTTYNALPDYAQAVTVSSATEDMVTWTQTKVLGTTSTYLYSVILYDDKGRPLQTKSKNLTGGVDIATTQYNWVGQPLVTVLKQEKAGTPVQTTVMVTKMSYDDLGRLLQTDKKIQNTNVNSNALPAAYTTLARNSYDALGQLKTKTLAPAYNNNTGLQTQTFDYNIRGWLLGVNRNDLSSNGSTSNIFSYELGYDKLTNNSTRGYLTAQYNGNISGMIWKSSGDGTRRKYDFAYDAANRLMKSSFEQNDGGAAWGSTTMNYSIQMGDGATASTAYDANGNLLSMKQYGYKVGSSASTPIDQLTYGYYTNSNRLKAVVDQQNDPATILGDFRTSTLHPQGGSKTVTNIAAITDYTYDANGNLLTDLNKDLVPYSGGSGIVYNYLNLPQSITVKKSASANKGTITYKYDASGNKLSKLVVENNVSVAYDGASYTSNVSTTTTYIAGFIYESVAYSNSSLLALAYSYKWQLTGHEEGRIRAVYSDGANPNFITGFAYDYFVKDHLGNVRMVLSDEVRQDVYPAASLEDAGIGVEKNYYDIQDGNIVNKVSYPAFTAAAGSNYANNNGSPPYNNNPSLNVSAESQKLYRLNGAGGVKFGLGTTLKVMAGDNVSIFGKSFYHLNNGQSPSNSYPVSSSLLSLLTSFTGGSAVSGHGVTGTSLNGSTSTTGPLPGLLNGTPPSSVTPSAPKAGINWILFDEQFRPVSVGFDAVDGAETIKTHQRNAPVTQNGYLYVYCSDESNVDVFFDNLQVIHTRGPLLEETHYYPFGLTMAGISSKAAGGVANKKKFTSQELDDDLDWNVYQFRYRSMDPQTGRFLQIDPLSTKYASNSTYAYAENKVTIGIDLEGLELLPINSAWFRAVAEQKTQSPMAIMNTWAHRVDVVASNVPTVFKDASGSPLFSASSVNVGPNGRILTGNEVGPQLMPGNNLPPSPGWTWGDGPRNPSRTASTGGWKVGTNLGDNKAFGDRAGAVAGAPREISNWFKLYTNDKPIWDAYSGLGTNKDAFSNAVGLVGKFENSISATMGGNYNPGMRDNLINFVQDGTLPSISFGNLRGSLESSLTTMWYGIQILNNSGSTVQQQTLDTYQNLMSLYNILNPSYNFDLNQQNKK